MNLTSLTIVLITITFFTLNCEAKRGCSTFGHSCYGGMGKRTYASQSNGEVYENVGPENPGFVLTGPRSNPSDLSDLSSEERKFVLQEYNNIYPYLKQWLRKLGSQKSSLQQDK